MALTKVTEKVLSDNIKVSGIITATTYYGDGSQLTGIDASTLKNGSNVKVQANASGVVITGVATASKFVGDGSDLTGVSGFATALSNTQGSLLNQVFKTPEIFTVGAGTSETISSDNISGNVAFARLGIISVGVGATLHVSAGTTMKMNILNVFP
tara:strand:- start:12 stop:476 length:465 start_codon:yes stop_codon:yes gene_type:complete